MSDHKNGYEIRLEILHLAQSIVSENIHILREWDESRREDVSVDGGKGVKYEGKNVLPSDAEAHTYSTEDVISEARKLYDFVQEAKD